MYEDSSRDMAQKFPDTKQCTDLKAWTNEPGLKEGKSYHGTLTYENEDHSTFVEDDPKQRKPKNPMPERQYKDLTGSLHGKISRNDHGVILHMYVRHGEYQNARALADIFEREVEQMCDDLSDDDLEDQIVHRTS